MHDGGWPRPSVTDRFTPIGPMAEVRAGLVGQPPGAAVPALLEAAPDLRRAAVDTGEVSGVTTGDLLSFPYPTSLALWRAARSPAPLVRLTARFLVVQWEEPVGPRRKGRPRSTRRRTLLWGAADVARALTVPAALSLGPRLPIPQRLVSTTHGSVLGHLRALGIDPAEVDLVAADHLQGRDLRPLLGTTRPAPDLGSPDAPLEGWFPNATLVTTGREWASLRALHPLQAPWYLPDTFRDLDPARIALVDGDVALGPGAVLVDAPGHTAGTTSLLLHTDEGVWVSSGNAVAAECYAPRASRIPGLRRYAVAWGQEVVLHANTPDRLGEQHDAMLLERALADPSPDAPFPRCFPLAELTASPLSPGLAPTYAHRTVDSGTIRGGPVRPGDRAA